MANKIVTENGGMIDYGAIKRFQDQVADGAHVRVRGAGGSVASIDPDMAHGQFRVIAATFDPDGKCAQVDTLVISDPVKTGRLVEYQAKHPGSREKDDELREYYLNLPIPDDLPELTG